MRNMTEVMQARLKELEEIQEEGGILRPADVVEFARDPSTALHSWKGWKDWNAEQAAESYWIDRARDLIRAMVTVKTINNQEQKIRAFVSILDDRKMEGG